MASVEVLSKSEKNEISKYLERYAKEVDDIDPDLHLFDEEVSDNEVNIRFFPTPESGEPESIYFEIVVKENAPWYEDKLGSYSADNMENGGPHYEALSKELKQIVRDVLGKKAEFVMKKGSGCFNCEVSV